MLPSMAPSWVLCALPCSYMERLWEISSMCPAGTKQESITTDKTLIKSQAA